MLTVGSTAGSDRAGEQQDGGDAETQRGRVWRRWLRCPSAPVLLLLRDRYWAAAGDPPRLPDNFHATPSCWIEGLVEDTDGWPALGRWWWRGRGEDRPALGGSGEGQRGAVWWWEKEGEGGRRGGGVDGKGGLGATFFSSSGSRARSGQVGEGR